MIEVVDFDDPTSVVDYGQTGRVKLTTLTKEFFMPGFLERDEGEREPPYEQVSVGRRQRRAAVPRLRGDDDGRRLLNGDAGTEVRGAVLVLDAFCILRSCIECSIVDRMLHISRSSLGQPYTSLEVDEVVHFATGEPIAEVSRANGGLIQRDMRKAQRARDVLREIPIDELIARVGKAGELYMNATLPMGDGTQTPDEFVRAQSASTGLPEHMCRANMKKNAFVLAEMRAILDVADARARRSTCCRAATAKSAACRSAIRRRARSSAWCCRRTRPACTRCGCRSSRCRSAWC